MPGLGITRPTGTVPHPIGDVGSSQHLQHCRQIAARLAERATHCPVIREPHTPQLSDLLRIGCGAYQPVEPQVAQDLADARIRGQRILHLGLKSAPVSLKLLAPLAVYDSRPLLGAHEVLVALWVKVAASDVRMGIAAAVGQAESAKVCTAPCICTRQCCAA
eukprot:4718446-Prymnesium_polylepis.1